MNEEQAEATEEPFLVLHQQASTHTHFFDGVNLKFRTQARSPPRLCNALKRKLTAVCSKPMFDLPPTTAWLGAATETQIRPSIQHKPRTDGGVDAVALIN